MGTMQDELIRVFPKPQIQIPDSSKSQPIPFPAEKRNPAAANATINTAVKMLLEWKECFLNSGGIFPHLFALILAVLQKVRDGKPDKEIKDAVDALGAEFSRLYEDLSAPPFNNPGLAEFKDLGSKLAQRETELTSRVAELISAQTAACAERETIAQKLRETLAAQKQFEQTIEDLQSQVRRLEAEKAKTKTADTAAIAKLRDEVRSDVHCAIERIFGLQRILENCGGSLQNFLNAADGPQPVIAAAIPPSTAPQPDPQQITGEINRRQELLAEISELLITAGEEFGKAEELIRGLEFAPDPIKRQRLEKQAREIDSYIEHLRNIETSLQQQVDKLQRHLKALETLCHPPTELFGQPLPTIPTFNLEVDPLAGLEAGGNRKGSETEETSSNVRSAQLCELAKQHNLTDRSVFLASLYEMLPDSKGNPGGKYRRTLYTVFPAAIRSQLFQAFGWEDPQEPFTTWYDYEGEQFEAVKPFLIRTGMCGEVPVFMRTAAPLPWQFNKLFTTEESLSFRMEIMKSARKKTSKI